MKLYGDGRTNSILTARITVPNQYVKRGSAPSWGTLGSAIVSTSVSQKRLGLKSLKRQTKAEELGDPVHEVLSLRISIKAI